ncbi:MAG: RNA 2',3'-cyclic phosphodiesterase [Clostridia bacterium]|nr:RNA 2',3'-cyclic phosphodiesterase [Clostridia bacterium]
MRLFIALELPQKNKDLLAQSVTQLIPYVQRANVVPKQNYHVTLHFLGEVDCSKVLYLQSLLDDLKEMSATRLVHTQTVSWRASQVICAKYKADENLAKVHRKLAQGLEKAGFLVEERRFAPHVTLMRKPTFTLPCSEALKHAPVYNMPFVADTVTLFCSEHGESGMVYTPLYSVQLKPID